MQCNTRIFSRIIIFINKSKRVNEMLNIYNGGDSETTYVLVMIDTPRPFARIHSLLVSAISPLLCMFLVDDSLFIF